MYIYTFAQEGYFVNLSRIDPQRLATQSVFTSKKKCGSHSLNTECKGSPCALYVSIICTCNRVSFTSSSMNLCPWWIRHLDLRGQFLDTGVQAFVGMPRGCVQDNLFCVWPFCFSCSILYICWKEKGWWWRLWIGKVFFWGETFFWDSSDSLFLYCAIGIQTAGGSSSVPTTPLKNVSKFAMSISSPRSVSGASNARLTLSANKQNTFFPVVR